MAMANAQFKPPPGLQELPAEARDPAQESLVSALRSSFAVLRLIMVALFALYALSGVFVIGPGDQGVVARLGKLRLNPHSTSPYYDTHIFTEGWIPAWPDPIDEKILIPGQRFALQTDRFLFRRSQAEIAEGLDIAAIRRSTPTLTPGRDGAMLTGDKNLSHGLWQVEYVIGDAARFVTTVGERPADLQPLLQRLFESSILREVAHRKVEEVTRGQIDAISGDIATRLQRELNVLGVGVTVVKVTGRAVVPGQIAPAFDDVVRSENQMKRDEEAARQRATEVLNQAAGPRHDQVLELIRRYGAAQLTEADETRLLELRRVVDSSLHDAQGSVAARLREAEAQANSIREQVQREHEEFAQRLRQHRMFPTQTRVRLWAGMLDYVLGSKGNEIFWVPEADIVEILVNRDPIKALEAEQERYMEQMEGAR
jgi:membrane protease subunit HflK